MLNFLRARRRDPGTRAGSVPDGTRVYAIGDIHGRLDLLEQLLARIEQDDAERGEARTQLIFLGDLIDRGPQSAGVVERLRHLHVTTDSCRFLLGNHEEVFLKALAGQSESVRAFTRIGGRETLESYGMTPDEFRAANYEEVHLALEERVPDAHRRFLETFEDVIVLGDYAFVHAGIRPGTPLTAQRTVDLRWIRDPFLGSTDAFERIIVHGHSISSEVEFRAGRIGIDTGAYLSGKLTALGLEGGDRWLLQT